MVYYVLKEYNNLIQKNTLTTLRQENMAIAKQNMLMTVELIKVMKLLEENDIEAISFKGPVLSSMAYGDITLRQYCDLDILIQKKELSKTIDLLLNNNYKNLLPLEIINNDICLSTIKDFTIQNKTSKVSIEIHWNLFEPKYKLAFKKLNILKTSNILIKENKIKTLSIETLLVYLCYHGSKHAWERIEWISDIDSLIRNNYVNFSEIDDFLEDNSLLLGLYLSHILFDTPLEKKYLDKIKDDKIVKLSEKVFEIMNDERYREDEHYRNKKIFWFQLDTHKKLQEKFKFCVNLFFRISVNDCQTYLYSSKTSYLFNRPLRLLIQYLKRIS